MSNFDKKFIFWFFKYIFFIFNIVLFILGCYSHKLGLIHWGDCLCLLDISFIFISVMAFFSLIFILYDISCLIDFIIRKHRYKKQLLNKLINDVEHLKICGCCPIDKSCVNLFEYHYNRFKNKKNKK